MDDRLFFYYWITFSILVLTGSALAFFWLHRKGYFRKQDRARYLALWADVPEEDKESTKSQQPNNK